MLNNHTRFGGGKEGMRDVRLEVTWSPHLLKGLLAATHVVVSYIRLVFNLHERDCGINLGRKWQLNGVLDSIDSDAHTWCHMWRKEVSGNPMAKGEPGKGYFQWNCERNA